MVHQPVVGRRPATDPGARGARPVGPPRVGTVPPDEFISLAEDDGLIVTLQRWVLQRATTDAAALLAAGWEVQMAVNVSVRHLQAGCLAPDVATRWPVRPAAAASCPGDHRVGHARRRGPVESDLTTLHGMGCILSVDDFGRGYSSLAYLARLPVDILKMDREFIADIERDVRGAAIVSSVIDMGLRLGMDVSPKASRASPDADLQDMRAGTCRAGFSVTRWTSRS